ncbi:hypothetical protein HQ531_15430 [bacterium]|nr:hypothetical protein [bacterium]
MQAIIIAVRTKAFVLGSILVLVFSSCEETRKTEFESKQSFLFEKTYGGVNYDQGYDLIELASGDLAIVGFSGSGDSGKADFHAAQLDAWGEMNWGSFHGGPEFDQCYAVVEDSEGNLFLGGLSNSFGSGDPDYYVVKLTADGDEVWTQNYGYETYESGFDMILGPDNCILLAGAYSSSEYSELDVGIIKLNSLGELLWQTHFGAEGDDVGLSLTQSYDDQILVAGWTNSTGPGEENILLMKLNQSGELLWEKALGSSGVERCNALIQCSDGGLLLAGYQFLGFEKNRDLYLLKTDAAGDLLWEASFGGQYNEVAHDIVECPEGGYVVAGTTESFSVGGNDGYLLKVNEHGEELWSKTFGGISHDYIQSVTIAENGDFIMAGYTYSQGNGLSDLFIIRTDSTTQSD